MRVLTEIKTVSAFIQFSSMLTKESESLYTFYNKYYYFDGILIIS